MRRILCLLVFCFLSNVLQAASPPIARTIIALYDNHHGLTPSFQTKIHRFAEMPLNYLGMKLEYHAVQEALPDLADRPDVRGILLWFDSGALLESPSEWMQWVIKQTQQDKKLVALGYLPIKENSQHTPVPEALQRRFLQRLGLKDNDFWVGLTYETQIVKKDGEMLDFERVIETPLPGYGQTTLVDSQGTSYLQVRQKDDVKTLSDLVVVTSHGGYIAEGYELYQKHLSEQSVLKWQVNPFAFFQKAFAITNFPIPDTTSLAGNRIFYAQVSGEGWVAAINFPKRPRTSAAQILYETLAEHPTLPITVAPVLAELDERWVGTAETQTLAKKIFALPNIEPATATYSAPLYWRFFENAAPQDEVPYLDAYPHGSWQMKNKEETRLPAQKKALPKGYRKPRTYANEPFDLAREIVGAKQMLQRFLPQNTQPRLISWTGNATPFAAALRQSRLAGLANLNGDSSFFDKRHHSYAWVAPLARQVGGELQINASAASDLDFIEQHANNPYGFRHVRQTWRNTDTPRRVAPLHLNFNPYSMLRPATLAALNENLDFLQTQALTPIRASDYSELVHGFYSSKIIPVRPHQWQIKQNGALQTFRMKKSPYHVDYTTSRCVIGESEHGSATYLYLDRDCQDPLIALTQIPQSAPYLRHSHWPIWQLSRSAHGIRFWTAGYGNYENTWQVQPNSHYLVTFTQNNREIKHIALDSTPSGQLHFKLDLTGTKPLQVSIMQGGNDD